MGRGLATPLSSLLALVLHQQLKVRSPLVLAAARSLGSLARRLLLGVDLLLLLNGTLSLCRAPRRGLLQWAPT